jgi:hypothetical protein
MNIQTEWFLGQLPCDFGTWKMTSQTRVYTETQHISSSVVNSNLRFRIVASCQTLHAHPQYPVWKPKLVLYSDTHWMAADCRRQNWSVGAGRKSPASRRWTVWPVIMWGDKRTPKAVNIRWSQFLEMGILRWNRWSDSFVWNNFVTLSWFRFSSLWEYFLFQIDFSRIG